MVGSPSAASGNPPSGAVKKFTSLFALDAEVTTVALLAVVPVRPLHKLRALVPTTDNTTIFATIRYL